MIFVKAAFQDGKDDFLDSTGYLPLFSVLVGVHPSMDDGLDSYAMGFEHASAIQALISERAKFLFAMGRFLKNPELSTFKSSLWGNHK